MSKVKLLWKATTVALAQRGPRVLEFLNREGKTEFYQPEMDEEGHILYEVSEEYGRRLLAGQSDRFFLVSPAKLIVKRRRQDNMGAEYVTLKAISGLTPPKADPANPSQGAQGPDGTSAPSQVPEGAAEGATASGAGLGAPISGLGGAETPTQDPEAGKTVKKDGPAAHPEKHKQRPPAGN
jgi:hypothetical protein